MILDDGGAAIPNDVMPRGRHPDPGPGSFTVTGLRLRVRRMNELKNDTDQPGSHGGSRSQSGSGGGSLAQASWRRRRPDRRVGPSGAANLPVA